MKTIFIIFSLLFFSQVTLAITPEQHYMNQEAARREYANAMQRTHDMLDRSIAAANDGKNVTQSASSSMSASSGGKVTGGGSVTKPINPSGVAKAIVSRLDKAKALGKATLPSFLGSAAVAALIKGVGWVMDEGGKVSKKDGSLGEYYWVSNNVWSDGDPVCKSPTKFNNSADAIEEFELCFVQNGLKDPSCTISTSDRYNCIGYNSAGYLLDWFSVNRIKNQNYDPNNPSTSTPVSNSDLENKITQYITNNTTNNISNTIINNAYSYDGSNGQTIDSASNQLAKDASKDITNAIDNSVNKPTDPKRPGYYKITDGTKTVEGYVTPANTATDTKTDSTSTTKNPDGSTSTTTGTGSSESLLPAFCDWASVVCEWIEWTKEEPEKEEEPERPEIDDQGIFSRAFDTVFSLSKQCPPDVPYVLETQYFKGSFTISLNWLCVIFTFLGYPLQLIAHLTGLWILYETVVRKEIKW